MNVKIHPEALGDLRDAIHWYESQRAGLGSEFFAVIDAAFAKIASNPGSCPLLETWTEDGDIRRLLAFRTPSCLKLSVKRSKC